MLNMSLSSVTSVPLKMFSMQVEQCRKYKFTITHT